MFDIVGPKVLEKIFGRINGRPGFEQCDFGSGFGQDLGGHAAGRPRADDGYIVNFGTANDLKHCKLTSGHGMPCPYA